MKKRNKEFDDPYEVLSDKAREKAERRYHALCYLNLAVKAVLFFLLGAVLSFLLKR